MKLTILNVTRNNVNAINALVRVALNQECSVTAYEVTDSEEALRRQGYKAAYDLYWNTDIGGIKRDDYFEARLTALEQAAAPYEAGAPQWLGWNHAVCDAKNGRLFQRPPIQRYKLTAECDTPSDINLLFRLARQLGQVYRNCSVTLN